MPPTPTALPPVVYQPITVSSEQYRMWANTDYFIQVLNRADPLVPIIQLAIVVILVFIFVYVLINLIQMLMRQK